MVESIPRYPVAGLILSPNTVRKKGRGVGDGAH